jgi:hypothetical protein
VRRRTHYDEIDKVLATAMWAVMIVIVVLLIALGIQA